MLRRKEKEYLRQIAELLLELIEKVVDKENTGVQSIVINEIEDTLNLLINRFSDNDVQNSIIVNLLFEISADLKDFEGNKETAFFIYDNLKKLRMEIDNMKVKYQVVFFPYKSSMWDSLESIWRAAEEDSNCECYVIPIPYYEKDNENMVFKYEGADFPQDVPIINYQNYKLEVEKPDVVYIHNPYDEYNHVSSIHPDYYSERLKKYAQILVYVPYYVTGGRVSDNHKMLSVYRNMDYMIVQSALFKDGFVDAPFYDKVIPLGSPKFDRVIKKCEETKVSGVHTIPTLFLNTSINCFLSDGELQIKKLQWLFEKIKMHKDIKLIWRPHPLLEATIKTLRPSLYFMYMELKEYFKKGNIGELDYSPDITAAIAKSDGYIGETASSVVHLFVAAGKPVFFLDNNIFDEFKDEERRRIRIMDMIEWENQYFFISSQCNGLFSATKGDWNHLRFLGRIDKMPNWIYASTQIESYKNDLYFSPYETTSFMKYNIKEEKFEQIGNDSQLLNVRKLAVYKDKIYYIQNLFDEIIKYDIKRKEYEKHKNVFKTLRKDYSSKDDLNMWDSCIYDDKIWFVSLYSSKIMSFCMKTKRSECYKTIDGIEGYSSICCDLNHLYLSDKSSGNIIKFNTEYKTSVVFQMPLELNLDRDNKVIAHAKILSMSDWIITIPYKCDGIVKIDKNTGVTKIILSEFCSSRHNQWNGYNPNDLRDVNFGKKINDTVFLIQRGWDKAIAIVDVENEEYSLVYPTLDETDFLNFMDGQDGFEKIAVNACFACRESQWFSIDDFINSFHSTSKKDIYKRQRNAISNLAVNLDGTCGEKVHKFMMENLQRD